MEDSRKKSCLAIEPYPQEDGHMRLFRELAGTVFNHDGGSIGRLDSFLRSVGADRAIFEDTRKSVLTKLLRKAGFRRITTYHFPERTKVQWRKWNEQSPEGMRCFGVAMDAQVSIGQASRRMSLSDRSGAIGEIVFSDFGRFVRAKANRFGSEGFGLVGHGKDPSLILAALARELIKERKRYLILGPEYSRVSGAVHPFPIWHMASSSQRSYEHVCMVATESDAGTLASLVSEYEDVDFGSALAGVMKNLGNRSFRYILPPGNEGFALLKFMEAAEGMINDLYVTPAHQGNGIGEELTRASISILSENCLNIHLNTIYPRARRLYEKHGFKVLYEDLCVALNQRIMVR